MSKIFNIYNHPDIYDDQYWWKKDDIEFYKNLISPGTTALELGSGTGRLSHPLNRHGVLYYGLEISKDFHQYALKKYSHIPDIHFINGDMMNFHLDIKFDSVFIAFNSFNHLLNDGDAIKCINAIKLHLNKGAKLILDIINPLPMFASRTADQKILTMDFKDSSNGELVEIYESCVYDYETEVCDIEWEYVYAKTSIRNKKLNYKMKMYYPDTMNRILTECGYRIDNIYGDYEMKPFNEESNSQIILCK